MVLAVVVVVYVCLCAGEGGEEGERGSVFRFVCKRIMFYRLLFNILEITNSII